MNFYAMWAIYKFEMARAIRTLGQSLFGPVISTSLYFVVFGAAIGSQIPLIGSKILINKNFNYLTKI